jgi:GTP-binding protein HflX
LAKLYGNTQGLSPSQSKRLLNLYRRKITEIIIPQQALDLARLSFELNRLLALALTRRGEVLQVLVGSAQHLPPPVLDRARYGAGRLSGVAILRTELGGKGRLGMGDAVEILRLRLDFLARLRVGESGLPTKVEFLYLDAASAGGIGQLDFYPGQAEQDLRALVLSQEEALSSRGETFNTAGGSALLVSVSSEAKDTVLDNLDELRQLAVSAGLKVCGQVLQRRQPDPQTLLGPGKLEEVLGQAFSVGADMLVLEQELSPAQAHHLALSTGSELRFIDRTQLILDIFAQRAGSREGKLQIEMAQQRYLLPRLSLRDDGLSRLSGGIGGRGPGETRLEIDRRRVRERLGRLEQELAQVSRQREDRRHLRQRNRLPVISIVGYTNAGKSTLLNALTNSHTLAEDRLFATLDPSSRRLRFPEDREVLITDTVGFIRNLPQELKRAFAATLEELSQASLILHVADASSPKVEEQIKAVEDILLELELMAMPRLLVLNKMDKAGADIARLLSKYQALAVCALKRESLRPLLAQLQQMIGEAPV